MCAAPAVAHRRHVMPLDTLVARLQDMKEYNAGVRYGVLLPQAQDEIVYTISLASRDSHGDPLQEIDYFISWSRGDSNGFSCYHGGNHYRYHDERLQEYHHGWDSVPFLTPDGGVQRSCQFADVFPVAIGHALGSLLKTDDFKYTYSPDTIYHGLKCAVVKGTVYNRGYVTREAVYVFDSETAAPVAIEYENNPGSISEQSVEISFAPSATADCPLTEQELIARYPEVFERYRLSNFSVENMPGTQLPSFSCSLPTGERYNYSRGDRFKGMTLVVFLDYSAPENVRRTLTALRQAAAMSGAPLDIMLAWQGRDLDAINALTGDEPQAQVTNLLGAKALARDCGVTSFPAILYVGADGKVKDVTLGYNQDLRAVVIQKTAL